MEDPTTIAWMVFAVAVIGVALVLYTSAVIIPTVQKYA